MHCLEQHVIKGSQRSYHATPLSVLDLLASHADVGGVYYFRRAPDITRLKASLGIAIDLFPSFSASVVREGNRLFLYHNNAGVLLRIYRDEGPFTMEPPLTSRCKLFGEHQPQDRTDIGHPHLNVFCLTLFGDGSCTLAFRNSNGLADAAAIHHFLTVWSRLYRGESIQHRNAFSRANIAELSIGYGVQPSHKLNLSTEPLSADCTVYEDYGATHVELPTVIFPEFVQAVRARSDRTITGSDVIHALIWRAHLAASTTPHRSKAKLYSAFDLRRVSELGISADYDGNAICERRAVLDCDAVQLADVATIAAEFNRQTKPITPLEIKQDITYLQRELARGAIDTESGRLLHYPKGSTVDCTLPAGGIYVNDMRFFRAADVDFGYRAEWCYLVPRPYLTYAAAYQTSDWSVSIHYFGRRTTLAHFRDHLSEQFFELT